MRKHLGYLRYVALHKLYVAMAGVALYRVRSSVYEPRLLDGVRFLWRLIIHDWSKFLPDEWRPYAMSFYGPQPRTDDTKRAFNRAWLLHQHRNAHHWQHWILREDSGATIVLVPPAMIADEMLADWMGAGTKILRWPSMAECVGETIAWYAANRVRLLMRPAAQQRIEETMHLMAQHYGLADMAAQVAAERAARQSIVIPGR